MIVYYKTSLTESLLSHLVLNICNCIKGAEMHILLKGNVLVIELPITDVFIIDSPIIGLSVTKLLEANSFVSNLHVIFT